MNIYLENGYLDIPEIVKYMDDNLIPYCFFVGQRGVGKSYGVLKYMVCQQSDPFVYFRLSASETDMLMNDKYNPFKKLNSNEGTCIHFKKVPHVAHDLDIIDLSPETKRGDIGLATPLDVFAKTRGADLSDFKICFLDEFIPEQTIRKTKGEGVALKQAFETINRNRELEGEKPLKFLCAANTNNLNNEILIDFKLIPMIETMQKKDYEWYCKDGILIIYPMHSPISEKKAETALYKSAAGSGSFRDMALFNKFARHYTGNIEQITLNKTFEMKFIYKDLLFVRGEEFWYVTEATLGAISKVKGNIEKVPMFGDSDYEMVQLKRKYYYLTELYFNECIKFERADLELQFVNLFKLDKKA